MLSSVPIWMTEVVPPAIRGTLVDIHGACLLFGYAFSDWVGYGFYFVDSPNAWRAPFGTITVHPSAKILTSYRSFPVSSTNRPPLWYLLVTRVTTLAHAQGPAR